MTKVWLGFLLNICVVAAVLAQNLNENTVLLGQLAPRGLNGYNDIWGYAANGREYALLGHTTGTSIVDVTAPSAPQEVAFIPGPNSPWRDIKTHLQYAYVTNETSSGLHIIDLQNLPNSAAAVGYYSATFQAAHNLYIDNGYAYIAGSNTTRGCNILSLSNPTSPVEVGRWSSNYWHDVIVKNDTIYGSAMGGPNGIDIVDGRNKAQLQLISRTQFPNAFTHNIWMTADNKYIAQTDEVWDLPVNFWEVTNASSPRLVATYTAGPRSIAHNAHIRDDFAFISYYYDGLKIIDITQRNIPIEVANYDTYPDDNLQRGRDYEGAWGAYPFLPSGNVLVSDIKYGLFVVHFNNIKAGFISGTITRAGDGSPVSGVKVELLHPYAGEGKTTFAGGSSERYLFGAKPGVRSFKFSKFGFEDFVLSDFTIQSGVTHEQDIIMTPKPSGVLAVAVKLRNGQPAPNARVIMTTGENRFETKTDQNGIASLTLPVATYDVALRQWGYLPKVQTVALSASAGAPVDLITDYGYVETFTEAEPWMRSEPNDDSIYPWEILPAADSPYLGRLPGTDHTGDEAGMAAITRARFGRSTLTSPMMDASVLQNPFLRFARIYNPYAWQTSQANDTLHVMLSNDNGVTWRTIFSYARVDLNWREETFRIADYLAPSAHMRVRFVNHEGLDAAGALRASAFGMIDDVKLISENALEVSAPEGTWPARVTLFQNYPNPFNPVTIIRWHQPHAGAAEILIFNVLGQRLASFKPSETAAGMRQVEINFSHNPSGIYFYQVKVGETYSEIKKMVLAK